MLHVEVFVPVLLSSYEFSINEHAKVTALIDEIVSVISIKEHREWEAKPEEMILANQDNSSILPSGKSLYQCKVKPGSRLILL